jgi:Fe2+ or Zn2+ uptake regulation protein
MQDSSHILANLKKRGHRITSIRKAILDLLVKSSEPLSSPSIQKLLTKRKTSANKTTVYREIAFLKGQNLVRELQFRDNAKRYEIMPENHHHHIVCVNCEKVEDVELKKDLDVEEKNITKNKKFKIINHSLEFYGVCIGCQEKQIIPL